MWLGRLHGGTTGDEGPFSALVNIACLFNLRCTGGIAPCPVGLTYATVSCKAVKLYCNAKKVAPTAVVTYLRMAGVTVAPCAAVVGDVETHLAADQGQRVWLDGAIMGAVEAHLAANRGHWVWLDGAVVGAIEAHLAAVAAVA